MQLEGRVAIVYGAAGSMGGAVSRAFGAEGARLFLAGRTSSKVRAMADEVASAGGWAQAAEVDVDDREGVERHAEDVPGPGRSATGPNVAPVGPHHVHVLEVVEHDLPLERANIDRFAHDDALPAVELA